MAEITPSGALSHKETYNILISLLADVTALKTSLDSANTLITELRDDHATFKTVVDDTKTLANDLRNKLLGDYVDGATALGIGSDAPKVAYGAFDYHINGQEYSKGESTVGVALSGATVPDAKAGAWALEVDASGTVSIVEAPDNGTGYASAVAALAALPAQTADKARMGTVTIVNNGATFVPGTTDLSAVTVTDAYADATPLLTTIGSAISSSSPATITASAPTAVGSLSTTS